MSEFKTIEQLARITRSDNEEMRIELTETTNADGAVCRFINIRVWYRGDRGDMLPGRQGLSLRTEDEVRSLGRALKAGLAGMTGEAPSNRQVQRPRPPQDRRHDWADDDDLTAGGRL